MRTEVPCLVCERMTTGCVFAADICWPCWNLSASHADALVRLRSRAEAAERERDDLVIQRGEQAQELIDFCTARGIDEESAGWDAIREKWSGLDAELAELRHFKATRTTHSTILKRAEDAEAALAEMTRERDEAVESTNHQAIWLHAIRAEIGPDVTDTCSDVYMAVRHLKAERDAALERERAADHLRPAYQQDALEQKRLRLAAEAREAALREALRPEVRAFAEAMEAKLRKHDGDRGTSWKTTHDAFLYAGLVSELNELTSALMYGDAKEALAGEAVDVANFAMFLFDKAAAALAAPADVTTNAIDTTGANLLYVYVPAAAPADEATCETCGGSGEIRATIVVAQITHDSGAVEDVLGERTVPCPACRKEPTR